LFDTDSDKGRYHGKKGCITFLKQMKEDKAYVNFENGLEDATSAKNHPKLKKLVEILMNFFSDPTKSESKVIVFS
jgi:ERCC4-related helicase